VLVLRQDFVDIGTEKWPFRDGFRDLSTFFAIQPLRAMFLRCAFEATFAQ
jgi:hypothetical protein